jgi:RecB family exonuclease
MTGGPVRLSYSAISTYLNCPLQYKLQYLDGLPTLPSPALSFGSSLHSALEWLYSVPTPDPPPLPGLLEHLESCWVSEGYESAEEEARYFLQGRSTLEVYYRNHVSNNPAGFRLPAAVEHKFVIDLGFCDLSGVIDRLDRDDCGGFEIVDYKTNRRLPPARRLNEDLQLPLYQIAAQRIWEVPVSRVTFHYLMMDHKASFIISPERERQALSTVERVAASIEREEFEPCRNNLCPWCDYIGQCTISGGRPAVRRRPDAPPLEIGQAIDELIAARGRVASGLARIEGLKDYVARYMSERSIERVGGSLGIACFDEDGCLVFLEEDARLF